MKLFCQGVVVALLLAASIAVEAFENGPRSVEGSSTILIEDFSKPIHKWSTMNDPVMGGESESALTVEDGVAKFTGTCAIVPFLKAPGFITMVTGGFFSWHKEIFPDVSSCSGLSFRLKTNVDYKGYRISFGKEHVKGGRHASGYKAGPLLDLPTDDFADVVIPFDQFSSKWDDATGDITVTCAEDSQYCPNQKWLSNMETLSFWGEGVEGEVDLEIESISAVGCDELAASLAISASIAPYARGDLAGGVFLIACTMTIIGVLAAQQGRKYNRSNYDRIPQKAQAQPVQDVELA